MEKHIVVECKGVPLLCTNYNDRKTWNQILLNLFHTNFFNCVKEKCICRTHRETYRKLFYSNHLGHVKLVINFGIMG